MTGPLISVVVPFYNNVDLLGDCLDSIAAQTYPDLQVIMVDDGSADGSAAVARAKAAADPRFTLVAIPNGGPGAARNRGVAAASGEYLAFVDSDDQLPPDAYATLLAVLERSGSDFVSGGVLRLSAAGLSESGLHDRAIKARRIGTHISATPELFYDISVWNKLFRRSFWDAAGLRLPEGMLWEDLVAMTMAHVLARSVDVITDPVYYWRDRDKGAPSITQSRTDIHNFRDRITAFGMIDDFLRARANPEMLRKHQHKALVNDLWLYVRDLSRTDADYQREFTGLAAGYLRQVAPEVTGDLPAAHKLAYYLITRGAHDELAQFATWLAAQPGRTPPMVRTWGRLRADLPLRRDSRLRIPVAVLRPQWRELDPYVQVDAISWQGGAVAVEGSAYVPSMDIGRRRHTTKLVVLVPRGRRRPPIVLPARSVRRDDVTQASGQDRYSYAWAGFRCVISPRWFRVGRRWITGDWDCFVLVRGRAVWRPARLHTPGPGAGHPQVRQVGQGVTFGAHWAGRRLQIRLRSGQYADQAAPAGQSWNADGSLVLRGTLPRPGDWQVVLRLADGWEQHVIPVAADGAISGGAISGGAISGAPAPAGASVTFGVAIPVGAMDVFGERRPLRDGRWEITLRPPPGDVGLPAGPPPGDVGLPAGPPPADVGLTVGPRAADFSRVRNGQKVYRCHAGPAGHGLLLSVGPVLGITERGRIRRRLLRDLYYPIQRLLPVRDAVMFMSFNGKQCGDNPRAIADELRRREDAREHIWAVSDWSVPVPAGARAVLTGTRAYFAALGRSSHLIVNDGMRLPFRKRPGQRYVQTWHGTPLKRLGYDIGEPRSVSGRRYLDFMAGDVAQWDLLLSPNPFSTPLLRQAFRFTGEICETGYPRNDALHAGLAGRATQIRKRLGLPDGKRVAMYLPTWRDDQHDAAGRYRLDFRLDLDDARRKLGDGFVLLIRGHHLMSGGIPAGADSGFVLDVTGYPDINDLLLVTDVLITDYSSVTFDFAPTGRPMLFFTYDLVHYRDQLRGFYFDFEAQAPGPLLATSEQVVQAMADLDAVAAEYAPRHAAFTARFCPFDDGKASARACDRIFGG